MASADDSDTNPGCDANCQANAYAKKKKGDVSSEQGSLAASANTNADSANTLKMTHQAQVKTTTAKALGTAQMDLILGEQKTTQDPTGGRVQDDALNAA